MAVTFVKDASTLTFPAGQNRWYPMSDSEGHKNGALQRTGTGAIAVDVRKGENPKQLNLSLQKMDSSFFNDLKAWYFNTVKGKAFKFNYSNDVSGESSMPVRWVNGFNFSFDGMYYSGEIVLEKEIT